MKNARNRAFVTNRAAAPGDKYVMHALQTWTTQLELMFGLRLAWFAHSLLDSSVTVNHDHL